MLEEKRLGGDNFSSPEHLETNKKETQNALKLAGVDRHRSRLTPWKEGLPDLGGVPRPSFPQNCVGRQHILGGD